MDQILRINMSAKGGPEIKKEGLVNMLVWEAAP
jgi:hypothetical protein